MYLSPAKKQFMGSNPGLTWLKSGWWFQTLFVFHHIWDNPSHWLIFFKMVKTTNQKCFVFFHWLIPSQIIPMAKNNLHPVALMQHYSAMVCNQIWQLEKDSNQLTGHQTMVAACSCHVWVLSLGQLRLNMIIPILYPFISHYNHYFQTYRPKKYCWIIFPYHIPIDVD